MKKKEIPFLAIGNEELDQKKPVGKTVLHFCGKEHEVKYGDRVNKDGTKTPDKLLGFVNCGKTSYLVAIDGREL